MGSILCSAASASISAFLVDGSPRNEERMYRDFQAFAGEAAKRHFRRFHRWFSHHGNDYIAEDAGSEAVLRFIELVQRGGLSPVWGASPVACLRTFVKSRLIDYGKAEARRVARNFRLDSDDLLSSASNPHEEFEKREMVATLGDSILAMPARDRQVFDYFITGPSSASSTAAALGLSTRQVYERSRSIRTRLRGNAALRQAVHDVQVVGAAR